MAFDIYKAVTDRIIGMLEQGIIPWEKPWAGMAGGARNYVTQKPYSLMNQLLLGGDGEWMSMKQCNERGGKVKKGSKAHMVVFWKVNQYEDRDSAGHIKTDSKGNIVMKMVPILRYYNVFRVEDCEGIEPHSVPMQNYNEPIEAADKAFNAYLTRSGVQFHRVVGDRAYYRPSTDEIVLPHWEQFKSAEEYYSTAFHEATHSTGHKDRLNRFPENALEAAFGSESYSKEELVAEIGSAACLCKLGIETSGTIRNSAAYIQSWLKALQNDKRLIVSAAGRAEKAVAMIFGEIGDASAVD